jgi:hypothetical protein
MLRSDLAHTRNGRRLFEDAPAVGGHCGRRAVTDPLEIAGELIVAEREHKTIAQFSKDDPDFDLATTRSSSPQPQSTISSNSSEFPLSEPVCLAAQRGGVGTVRG